VVSETLVERNRDPRFPERISAVDLGETRVKKQGSQWSSAHRRIENSRAKSLVHEIVISDFPRGSEVVDHSGDTWCEIPEGRVRHFGVLVYNGIAAGETTIS
jgi:hypothetical protein